MTNKEKTSISVHFDNNLLAKIDNDAADNLRSRKAQVEYIVKQYYSNIGFFSSKCVNF